MTKLLLTTALSTLIAFSAYSNAFAEAVANPEEPAQQTEKMPKHHKEMRKRPEPEKMDKFLDLTDEQKAKAKEIREQSFNHKYFSLSSRKSNARLQCAFLEYAPMYPPEPAKRSLPYLSLNRLYGRPTPQWQYLFSLPFQKPKPRF